MKKKSSFLKTTLLGGLIFLIPFVIIVAIIGKALKIMMIIAEPFAKMVPFEAVAGIAIVNFVVVIVVILICFIAGLLARSTPGRRAFKLLDQKLMEMIPGYAFVKGFAGSIGEGEDKEVLQAVLVKLDDQSMIGFEVERTDNGLVAVYIPGSPSIWAGTIAYMTPDRVEKLDAEFTTVSKTLRTLGRGSNEVFKSSVN
jgi:uncharacterized membrane protein